MKERRTHNMPSLWLTITPSAKGFSPNSLHKYANSPTAESYVFFHADPDHLWNGLECGYTMTKFRQDVANTMNQL